MSKYEHFLENSIKDAIKQIKELSDLIEKYETAIHDIAPWLSASLNDKCCQEYVDHCNNIFKLDKLELLNDKKLIIEIYKVTVDDEETIRWYNQKNQLHRLDGPAVEYPNGNKAWYQNGLIHRLDGPAIEHSNGYKAWYQNGLIHRKDGPAIEYPNGTKSWYQKSWHQKGQRYPTIEYSLTSYSLTSKVWYQNDNLHRLNGPAIEYLDGSKEWFQNGLLHRLNGPAVEYSDGSKVWFQNGLLHRLNGPAVENPDGSKKYYIEGINYSEEDFIIEMRRK